MAEERNAEPVSPGWGRGTGPDMSVPCGDGIINLRVGAIILKEGRFLMVRNADAYYYNH